MNIKIKAPEISQGKIWVSSFDIGKKNFAFYIEEFDQEEISNINKIPKQNRYNPDGTPTSKMTIVIKKIYNNGKTILFKNCDLTKNCSKGSYLDPETFHNLTDLLDEYKSYWDNCNIFVIEQQMRRNPMALKLGQHCYSYFTIVYGRFKQVIEFPSYHKTQILGCKKNKGKQYKNGNIRWVSISKPERKKWSIKMATQILENRGEIDVINKLKSKKKKDDLADVVCQLQSFKILTYF